MEKDPFKEGKIKIHSPELPLTCRVSSGYEICMFKTCLKM